MKNIIYTKGGLKMVGCRVLIIIHMSSMLRLLKFELRMF